MLGGFSGEAIATLWGAGATALTGLAAVIAAMVVGLKQVKLANRQTEILGKQVDIERAKLAHDLYEKRYKAYVASSALIVETMSNKGDRPSNEAADAFFMSMREARFLYPDPVYDQMFELWSKVDYYFALERKMNSDRERTGRFAEGDPDRSSDVSKWLQDRAINLHAMFPQLYLTETGQLPPA